MQQKRIHRCVCNMCSCRSRFATATHNSETSDLSLCRVTDCRHGIHGRSAALFHSIRASLVKLHFERGEFTSLESNNGFGCLNHCSAGPHQLGTPLPHAENKSQRFYKSSKLRSSVASRTHLPHSSQVVFIGIASCIDNHTINLVAVAAK
jgi:hypothetical protein